MTSTSTRSAVTTGQRLEVFSVILLQHAGRWLLLQRAPTKRLFPSKWTGVGGQVEPREFDDLATSALRELREETGIDGGRVTNFYLRRVLLRHREGDLNLILYFTGELLEHVEPPCPEGTLAWVAPGEVAGRDLIDTARTVIPLLLQDHTDDPAGRRAPHLGVLGPQGPTFI